MVPNHAVHHICSRQTSNSWSPLNLSEEFLKHRAYIGYLLNAVSTHNFFFGGHFLTVKTLNLHAFWGGISSSKCPKSTKMCFLVISHANPAFFKYSLKTSKTSLNLFPLSHFCSPLKIWAKQRFSDVFRGQGYKTGHWELRRMG